VPDCPARRSGMPSGSCSGACNPAGGLSPGHRDNGTAANNDDDGHDRGAIIERALVGSVLGSHFVAREAPGPRPGYVPLSCMRALPLDSSVESGVRGKGGERATLAGGSRCNHHLPPSRFGPASSAIRPRLQSTDDDVDDDDDGCIPTPVRLLLYLASYIPDKTAQTLSRGWNW